LHQDKVLIKVRKVIYSCHLYFIFSWSCPAYQARRMGSLFKTPQCCWKVHPPASCRYNRL